MELYGRIKNYFQHIRAVTEIFTHPFTNNPLLSVFNGAVAADEASSDISNAKLKNKNFSRHLPAQS